MRNTLVSGAVMAAVALMIAWAGNARDEETAQKNPQKTPETSAEKTPQKSGPAIPLELEGVHNTFRLGRKIYSGSCPEGEAGFRALAQKGVKTVISVDGARPDEQAVLKYGMRYVHIPVNYNGITRDQALSIARAVRDLPGPVFIHCHHGKHRGPAAAVLAAMVNEGWTSDDAEAAMRQAGTSPHYTGLWQAARDFKKPTKEELAKADATFPAAAPVPATAAAMVNIDLRWEHIGDIRAANWSTPANHPDIVPEHEALLLREDFRELQRAPDTAKRPADYMKKLAEAEAAAQALENALRGKDPAKAQAAYKAVSESCKSCHSVYRDVKYKRD